MPPERVFTCTAAGEISLTFSVAQLSVFGHGFQLDSDARTLSVAWQVSMCGARTMSPGQIPDSCGPPDQALDVYLNECVHMLQALTYLLLTLAFSLSTPVLSYSPSGRITEEIE